MLGSRRHLKKASFASARFFSEIIKKNIGFIGLGNMGLPMVTNLLKKGHSVTVFDLDASKMKKAETEGAIPAADVAELAKNQDACITLVSNTEAVRKIRMSPNGIFENARKGSLVIDSSTISPTDTKEMTEVGEKLGLRIADVPISGGYMGAIAGTLTCIVGCRQKDFQEISDIYK